MRNGAPLLFIITVIIIIVIIIIIIIYFLRKAFARPSFPYVHW